MRKQVRRMIPVFFAMCLGIFPMFCGCGREPVFRFETAESAGTEEYSGTAGGPGSGQPAESSGTDQTEAAFSADEAVTESAEPETIWVYVCGAVRVPGVYELPAGGRVYQALEAAGGVREEAELRSLNQAAVLTDGEQITVYTAEEIAQSGGIPVTGVEAQAGRGKINLNTAGPEELMTLSGIGQARARAIIAYREEHGPFTAIEEVMNIEGIKEKAFGKIKDEIEV